MSWEEYLALEDSSGERWMYWDGERSAVAGGTLAHDEIESNLHGLLSARLLGSPCRAFTGNRRLRALNGDRSAFADASILCGASVPHPTDPRATTNPTAVFEVLSDATEAFDRGDKFAWYRSFPSLRVVVFLSQKQPLVEVYSRQSTGTWVLQACGPGELVQLSEPPISLPVDALYRDVHWEDGAASVSP